ncbi:MAG: aminoacyl-tRNA hydrolase [Candidimonas sp.]
MATKQVIVMRKDLGMRKGKMISQGAHASKGTLTKNGTIERRDGKIFFVAEIDEKYAEWLESSYKKITLYVKSEEELYAIYENALKNNLRAILIIDNGDTEFHGTKTPTCVAIGPDDEEKIDVVTGELDLL